MLLALTVMAGAVEKEPAGAKPMAAKWTDHWYSMRNLGKKVGWLHLKQEEKEGMLLMTDEMFFMAGGGEARTTHTVTSRMDEYLSPVTLSLAAKRPEKPWTIEGVVAEGRLKAKNAGEGKEGAARPIKPGFATEFSVMRLVTQIPKTKACDIELLEMWERPVIHEGVLKFDQDEPIQLERGNVTASRFTLANSESADRIYWLDAKGTLVKMKMLGRIEFELTDEKIARNMPENMPKPAPRAAPAEVARQAPLPESALPVFPGAEGYGTRTRAGRGGKVIEVTSLEDSGPGSLRAALSDTHPRTIVFRVGGTIQLKQALSIQQPFVTVAGQTAPGDGILLKDFGLVIETHDVLVQHLRIRPGNEGAVNPEDNDALQINGGANVVVDHVSASWGEDEVVQTWSKAHDVTLSWCFFGEALDKSRHAKGRHAAGVLIGDGSDRISLHHCLMAHNDFRNPLIINSVAVDVVENVIYNWGRVCAEIQDNAGFPARVNVVGNRYIAGPSSNLDVVGFAVGKGKKPESVMPKVYAADNVGPHQAQGTTDAYALFRVEGARLPDELRSVRPFETRAISRLQAPDVVAAVLAGVGATLPRRDPVDQGVVENVRKGDGRIINSPADVGGYPKMQNGEAPEDADHDGIPDEWEKKMFLNPREASDAARDRNGDGYTNLEEYLQSLSAALASKAK